MVRHYVGGGSVFNLKLCRSGVLAQDNARVTTLNYWINSCHDSCRSPGPLCRPVRLHSHRALSLPTGVHAQCQVSGGVSRARKRWLHCLWKPRSLSRRISSRKERWDRKASKVIWFFVSGGNCEEECGSLLQYSCMYLELHHGLYSYICHRGNCTVYRHSSERGKGHKNKWKTVSLEQ